MTINDLALEITRKCNLKCEHCLRGNAQNKTMTEDIMHNLFQHVDHIGMLTIAGGEPSLAIDTLKKLHQHLVWYDVTVDNIFLVTNGKRVSKQLLEIYARLYNYCSDKDISGFAISNDYYHQTARGFHRPVYDYIDKLYDTDEYLPEEKIYEHTSKNKSMRLLARGRAKDWGDDNKPYLDCLKLDDLDNPTKITGEMYVCYDGTVVGDMNMCYLDMKKYARGNVNDWTKLLSNLKQSTVDNYYWCQKNCKYSEDCSEYDETAVAQILAQKLKPVIHS